MASEIRVNKLNSQTGVGTITLSPTGVDISGITTAETLKATTGIVTTLTATTGIVTTLTANTARATTGIVTTLTANTARATTGIVTTLTATTGIVTTLTTNTLTANSTAKVGSGVTLSPDGDVFVTGVTTSSTVKVGAAVTISESGIEASGIGITCANINGTQIGGRRNIVINGDFRVAQRATSYTGGSAIATVDRWFEIHSGTDENPTQSQGDVASGTSPYAEGLRKTFKITNGNQTSIEAADFIGYKYVFEAQDIATSGWNYTSPSSFVTLSFWIKTSVTNVSTANLRTYDVSPTRSFKFDVSTTANTWKKVVIKVPGNSNLGFDNNNGAGLVFHLYTYLGTTYRDADTYTETWIDGSPTNTYGNNNVTNTFWNTDDATVEITGVQLEVGSQATAFEHRSFAEELTLCQRYFQVLGGSNGTYDSMATGSCSSSTVAYVPHRLVHTMRTTPSFTLGGSASDFRYTKGGDQTPSGLALDQAGANMVAIRVSAASDHLGTDDAIRLFNVNTTGSLQFDAEI